MTSWIVEIEWLGKLIRCNDLGIEVNPDKRPDNLTHDKQKVWGFVAANTRDEALAALKKYMKYIVKHEDEVWRNG